MDLKFWMTIIISAIIAVLFIILYFWFKKRKIIKSGKLGERKVAKILNRYATMRGYKVINDFYLPLYDKTTQIDHILIGYFGIIVIETKNYKGSIYGDPSAKSWSHIVGNDRNEMYNPLKQNQTHIDCIRHIISKANIYNVKIDSLIVFANKKTDLFIPKGLPIIKINKLKKFLKQGKYMADNGVDVEKIYNTLSESRVTDKSLISKHNKNVKEMSKK